MINRCVPRATIALLLALAVPASAASAAEATTPAAPAASESTQPAAPPPMVDFLPIPEAKIPIPEAKITSAEAEAALKALFKLPQTSERVQLDWQLSRMGDKPVWQLNVTIREGNSSTGFQIATVDGMTGRLLQYGAQNMMPGPIRMGPLTTLRPEAEAKAKAWSLVQQLAPEKAALLKEAPERSAAPFELYNGYGADPTREAYSFTWLEHHDGIPFSASSVTVSVDKHSLDYVSANVNLLDGVKVQAGPAKVTAEEALKVWQAEAKPTLVYQPVMMDNPYGTAKPTGYKLVYTFGNMGRPVDAMTGTWAQDLSPYASPAAPTPAEPEAVPAGSVTPLLRQALPLSEVEAQKLARAVLEAPPSANLRTGSDSFGQDKLTRFSLSDQTSSGSVSLDPQTGLIRNAYRSQRGGAAAPPAGSAAAGKVTAEQEAQAKAAALAVVQTFYSQLREQLRVGGSPMFFGPQQSQLRRFHFDRYVNGISVPNEAVNVTIDLATMKWRDLSANWTTGLSFPSAAGVISADKAQATAMADRKPTLVYRPVFQAISRDQIVIGPPPQPTEAALAYVLRPEFNFQVDALTGQAVTHDSLSVSDMEAAYKQILGHSAEGELKFILSRRIVSPAELKPDGALTRGQAVTLLVNRNQNMYGGGEPGELPYTDLSDTDPAYEAVRTAWLDGWLGPLGEETAFRAGSTITRAEFALWAARTLGLGDLARSRLSVQSDYKDLEGLTAEQRNAANFLQAMGLLPPGEAFRGGESMTQAEGAALTVRIYNYLVSR